MPIFQWLKSTPTLPITNMPGDQSAPCRNWPMGMIIRTRDLVNLGFGILLQLIWILLIHSDLFASNCDVRWVSMEITNIYKTCVDVTWYQGPWGLQDPGGLHVGSMKFAISVWEIQVPVGIVIRSVCPKQCVYAFFVFLRFLVMSSGLCGRFIPIIYACTSDSGPFYSLSGRAPYHNISQSLEAARFGFKLFSLVWNLTGT